MTAVAVESKIERIGITDAFGMRCLVPKYGSHVDGQKSFARSGYNPHYRGIKGTMNNNCTLELHKLKHKPEDTNLNKDRKQGPTVCLAADDSKTTGRNPHHHM